MSFRTLAGGQRKAGEAVLEDKVMLCLKELLFLFLLHTQFAKALPVPPEDLEEKNAKTVEVNELLIMGDLLMATEFRGQLSLLGLNGRKEIFWMTLLRLNITFWDLEDSKLARSGPGISRQENKLDALVWGPLLWGCLQLRPFRREYFYLQNELKFLPNVLLFQ